MELANQVQIVIQHLVKITALLSGLGQNHGKMQGNSADIETSHKYRLVQVIGRMHPPSLIPGRQKCPAPHGRDDTPVLSVHACHIAFSCQAQPVRIHGLGRTVHARLKHILQRLPGSVQIFVV